MFYNARHALSARPGPFPAALLDSFTPHAPDDPAAEPFDFLAEFDDPEAGKMWKIRRADGSIAYVSVADLFATSICTL